MKRLIASLLTLSLLGFGITSAQADDPSAGSSGMGDRYFPSDGNGGYDVQHYDVAHRVGVGGGSLTGRTTFQAHSLQALNRFNVDIMLKVNSVKVDGVPAGFTKESAHELVITPATPIPDDTDFAVEVRYSGKPSTLSWKGERPFLRTTGEMMAMNEPQIAPWWFAANDHPRDKATIDVRITVGNGYEGISNGRLTQVVKGKRWTAWQWRSAEPMAPYLAFFAAGDFAFERGMHKEIPTFNAVSKKLSKTQQKRSLALLRRTPRVIAWLETWLGPYPFTAIGGVTTAIRTGFALENQTRPTYPYAGGAEGDWLVAHEIAHQWFGDKVSVNNWRDVWLNEGLATYFETLWSDNYGFTSPQQWLRFSWESYESDDSFWRVRLADPGPRNMFHEAVYERGAMTIQALRHRIGTTDFKKLMRAWVKGRDHGSTEDFVALAEEVSGEDLTSFFDAWVRSTTRPARTAANGLN
ncbi:MAG TPA: M1 family metallopeptidase [Nocardioides sp.]